MCATGRSSLAAVRHRRHPGLRRRVQDAVQGTDRPDQASPFLYRLAPLFALAPAFAAWALIPFGERHGLVLADVNAGLLALLALTSMGVYGIILGGWASNSKYAILGALRSASQVISYEIAMGFALVGVLVAAGSMNMTEIVHGAVWR